MSRIAHRHLGTGALEQNSWDKKASVKGRFHAETILTTEEKRNVNLVCAMKVVFICEVANAPPVPAFAEWEAELERLKGKIQKSQENQERLELLQENISMEHKRLAKEQVLSGLQMNRDCSVLGIGSGVQTETDQDFYCSAETETETEHPVAPRDRTEMSPITPRRD